MEKFQVGTFQVGMYGHYKGGRYHALMLAETHNHNGDRDVIYMSMLTGKIVTRPFKRDSRNEDSWTDIVIWPDGVERPRFVTLDQVPGV